jgi:hypothetical protein
MRVPTEVVRAVWDRYAREGRAIQQMVFADAVADAIDLQAGPGGGHVLRADGKVFEWDTGFETLRPADRHSSMQAISIAARRLPELRAALPTREDNSIACATCAGAGFLDLGDRPAFLVCEVCDGLGWTAA